MSRALANLQPQTGSGTFAALRHRNFQLMWISLLVSNAGSWLQTVAQDALVYQITGRALDLGIINVVRAVALISLSFLGGTIADRLDKRKLLIFTQTAFAATAVWLGYLVRAGTIAVWHVVLASFINAVLLALDQPARQALLPYLVPREDFMNAVALNSVTFTGAAALGPALAGPLVRAFGVPWGFYLNGISFFAVVWAVWAMNLPARQERRQTEPVLQALMSGVHYTTATPALLLLISLLAVFSFFAIPYQSVLPVFADRIFHSGVDALGYMRAASGIGALLGGFLLAAVSDYPRKDLIMIIGGLGFVASLIWFSVTAWLPGALILLLISGLMMTLFQSTIQSLMQLLTEDQMRGRVMSLFTICLIGMWPLGAGPMSVLADLIGVGWAVIAGCAVAGVFAIGVTLGARRLLVQFRR